MLNKKIKLVKFFLFNLLLFTLIFSQVCSAEELGQFGEQKIKLQAVLTPPYVVGPGDQLTITDRTLKELFGQVERYDLVVSADGYISIPLPDGKQVNILVAGHTLDEVSEEVRKLFAKTLKNPLVFVQISKYRPVNVYIGGEVVNPGVYKVETTSTNVEGGSASSNSTFNLSLTQAIQLAGGLKPRADITSIHVTRGVNNEKKILNLKSLVVGESILDDTNLLPGDTVYVPLTVSEEDQAQTHVRLLGKLAYQEIPVNVVGEVKTSGSFTLPNDATLLDALGKAGGLNNVGSLKLVRLSRFENDGVYRTHEINIHDLIMKGSSFDQIAIKPSDTIEFIPSKGKETRHFMRDVAPNLVSTAFSTVLGSLGNFIVQDNLFDRNARLRNGGLSLGGGGNPITILGKRLYNNSNSNE